MAKKMCPNWSVTTSGGQMCYGAHIPTRPCPKNVNPHTCRVIPAKKKDRVVKGWAWIRDGKIWDACVRKWSMTKNLIPCTIRVKAADWAKLKGKK